MMTIKHVLIIAVSVAGLFCAISAQAKSCKAYASCREVILDHPDGWFGRRDGDKDGIPCENVCSSIRQVQTLLDSINN